MVLRVEKSKSQTLACQRSWMMITTAWTVWTSHHREQAPTGKTKQTLTGTVTQAKPLFRVNLKGSTQILFSIFFPPVFCIKLLSLVWYGIVIEK